MGDRTSDGSEEGRDAMLDQIKQGKQLKHVRSFIHFIVNAEVFRKQFILLN